MNDQQPLRSIFHSAEAKQQQRRGQKWRVALLALLRGLVLLCLLTLPASMNFVSRKPVPPAPFVPVGDSAVVTAPGFDTCIAPPADLLQTWWDKSPYQWLNVYLGGVSMFPTCGGKNLNPAWVVTVYRQGWSLLPTWVGHQAPCALQHAVMSKNTVTSYAQGQSEADAAIAAADRLGFASTAPIYFDMEHFNAIKKNGKRDETCIQAVNAFLKGWKNELIAHNRPPGVYASASNYPLFNGPNETVPFVAWIAGGGAWSQKYDHRCTVYGNKFVADSAWNGHQRIYQYTGGHNETYGKKTWNIDSDCADAPMVGHITAASLTVKFQDS